ncbi:MAG: major capsid protein [Microvirus sp.]|nr:MAG: major capsid protein [Microvirus sp.]
MMHSNKSVNVHQFAMVPKAEIPRSSFRIQTTHKTTFDAGLLIPIYVDEILPGDTYRLKMTAFARLATPIFPIMDNLYLDSHWFFVPCRLLWSNWVKFMGEQDNPGDSISYTIPQVVSPIGGWPTATIGDYFGIPGINQVAVGNTLSTNALPFRAYNLIYDKWFKDQNLQNNLTILNGDGPDPAATYSLVRRGKRHDYFTSSLPFVQKGTAVTIPLGTSAPVRTSTSTQVTGAQTASTWRTTAGAVATNLNMVGFTTAGIMAQGAAPSGTFSPAQGLYPDNLFADLSQATAATINALRLSFQVQRLLERDARGGTRYQELNMAHFGVRGDDARLQKPEFLNSGSQVINVHPVAQTAATQPTITPQGNLAAYGTSLGSHGFTQSFTEHGYIIGLVSVRADLTYQQGLRKMWSRQTRYDFYFPVFAMLGEQPVLNREIFADGSANDLLVFGYQERWAEMRYNPAMISGLFRSTAAGTLDAWHLAQKFAVLPTLNTTFIQETPPMDRIEAVPTQPDIIFDSFFDISAARCLPMYSVPGMIDHF